jgi:hypothetical protein
VVKQLLTFRPSNQRLPTPTIIQNYSELRVQDLSYDQSEKITDLLCR